MFNRWIPFCVISLLWIAGCNHRTPQERNLFSRSLEMIGSTTNWIFDQCEYENELPIRYERLLISGKVTNLKIVEYTYVSDRIAEIRVDRVSNGVTNRSGKLYRYSDEQFLPTQEWRYDLDGVMTNYSGYTVREWSNGVQLLVFDMEMGEGRTNRVRLKTHRYRPGRSSTVIDYDIIPLSDGNLTNTVIRHIKYSNESPIGSSEYHYSGDSLEYQLQEKYQ